MKILTSFTHLVTGEGDRISFTYSELDEQGNVISQNNRENFVVTDSGVRQNINAIRSYITENKLGD